MQTAYRFEVKSLNDGTGEFEGLASTYGNLDDVGDIVQAGAFTRTLAASKQRPLYYNHRASVGLVELSDSPAGLMAKGRIELGLQEGRDTYTRLKGGIIGSMSIGYEAVKSEWMGEVRNISEIKLWEVSLVEMPANSQARVTSMKSLKAADALQFKQQIHDYTRSIAAALKG